MAKVVKAEGFTPCGREMAGVDRSGQTMHEFVPRYEVSKQALGWWRWELKQRALAACGARRSAWSRSP